MPASRNNWPLHSWGTSLVINCPSGLAISVLHFLESLAFCFRKGFCVTMDW